MFDKIYARLLQFFLKYKKFFSPKIHDVFSMQQSYMTSQYWKSNSENSRFIVGQFKILYIFVY